MILCVGPIGSGKSLLLKRLQNRNIRIENYNDIPLTVPTVGTNIVYIKDNSKTTTIQEVGGSMADIWDQYYKDCNSIMFVIESTNLSKIGDSSIDLFKMVFNSNVKNKKPIVIVLNKSDIACSASKEQIRYFLMIDELINSVPNQQIEVLESSSLTGMGLDLIYNWIQRRQQN